MRSIRGGLVRALLREVIQEAQKARIDHAISNRCHHEVLPSPAAARPTLPEGGLTKMCLGMFFRYPKPLANSW